MYAVDNIHIIRLSTEITNLTIQLVDIYCTLCLRRYLTVAVFLLVTAKCNGVFPLHSYIVLYIEITHTVSERKRESVCVCACDESDES